MGVMNMRNWIILLKRFVKLKVIICKSDINRFRFMLRNNSGSKDSGKSKRC